MDGRSYLLSDHTVVLDAEGVLDFKEAYKNAADAFDKVNQIGDNAILLVAPSVYWLDNPDDHKVRTDKGGTPFAVKLHCDTLSIIGLADNPDDIVFAVNRGQTQGAVGNYTMFQFSGNSLELKNITFGNYCNIDLEYPRNPLLNRKKRKDAIVQAQIGICVGTDRLFVENCRFLSRLNLCPFVGARRSLYDKCYFECTDDALSGSAVYLDCKFKFFSSKPFYSTAETGAVFLNCDITCLGSGNQCFTKVPGQVTVIDTRFHTDAPINIQWTRDASDILCWQENVSLNGSPYIIDADRQELGPKLQESYIRNAYLVEYDGKKVYNLPNLLNGDDGWDPKGLNSLLQEIESKSGSKLTRLPVALKIHSDASSLISDGDTIHFFATPLLWGSYPASDEEVFSYIAQNSLPKLKHVIIPIASSFGLSGRYSIDIQPKLKSAPFFKKKPSIRFDKATRQFAVDYSLSGKGEDASAIMWCRLVNEADGPKLFPISRSDAPKGRHFSATAGDFGYGLVAVVFPKFSDSKYGAWEVTSIFELSDPNQVVAIPESTLSTDFSDIVIEKHLPGIPGIWNFDIFKPSDTAHVDWEPADGPGWYYGKGFDASVSKGLVQSEKGARMSYVPARDICKNMSVSLIVEPAKSGGQGFGSATAQYMDICLKFDPVDLNGYALRIERTSDHDRAVSFSLIKYDGGATSKISEEVISNCYRTPCHISVEIVDGILKASAYSEAEESKKCCDEVVEKVTLSAQVEESLLTGFCIQHTGSTGPSSTLIRNLDIKWE